MRDAFARAMTELATERVDVCLLSGDIGNRMFDNFKKVAPERFINCGIAEANMMSVAAGMGLNGLKPVVYTITPFTTIRCLEQIKIGCAYHQSPVVIVGTGSGLSYSELGPTHHSLDDIALMRCIPDIDIYAPCDSNELISYLRGAINSSRPSYIRIGKKGEPLLTGSRPVHFGRGSVLHEGHGTLLIGCGPVLGEAINGLKNQPVEVQKKVKIVSMPTIRPLDAQLLERLASEGHARWIVLEEHYRSGGLTSSIEEWLQKCRHMTSIDSVESISIPMEFINVLGKQDYARKLYGLDRESILKRVIQ